MRLTLAVMSLVPISGCSFSVDAQDLNPTELFSDQQVVGLADAACQGNPALVQKLVAEGADPNAFGKDDFTPLLYALHCRNISGFTSLIQNGADVDLISNGRHTPVILATSLEDASFLDVLLKSGADPYLIPPKANYNAIGMAFRHGFHTDNWQTYEFFLLQDIDLNRAIDRYGNIDLAIHSAIFNRYDRVLELLDMGYARDLERLEGFVDTGPIPADPVQAGLRVTVRQKIADLLLVGTNATH